MIKRVSMWCGAILLCAGASSATVVVSDNFSYPDGSLIGQGAAADGWLNPWGGNGPVVSSGQVVMDNIANPPKYASRSYTNPAATTELFVKFTLTTPPAFVTTDYFALALTLGANTTVLSVGKGTTSNNFGVGVSALALSGITATPGTTYNIVAGVVYAHGPVPNMQLIWVNPDGSDFYNAATGANSADAVGFEPNFFHSATITLYSNLAGVKFDNLVLCDAIEQAIPTPCPGDVNGDGFTNTGDFNILAGNFGAGPGATRAQGDLSGDGFVNTADFNILAGDFGCP